MGRIIKYGVELGTSGTLGYTVTAGTLAREINISFLNRDTSETTPTVWIAPSGEGTPEQDKYQIIGGSKSEIPAGQLSEPYRIHQFLEAGDFIQWKADVASKITAFLSSDEFTIPDATDSVQYLNFDAALLTASVVILHTINSLKQGTFISLMLHNIDTVPQLPTVHLIQSGGSVSDANMIVGGAASGASELAAGEMVEYRWRHFLGAGDTIRAKGATTLKIVAKLSVLEETA